MEISPTDCMTDSHMGITDSLSAGEQNDVKLFIEKHQNNGGILDLITAYLISLAGQAHKEWWVIILCTPY